MKGDELSPRQELFCIEYLKDLNGKEAAIRAGFSEKSASHTASVMLKMPKIKSRIQAQMDKRSARIEITADQILRELAHIAMVDIKQIYGDDGQILDMHAMPESARRAIGGIEVTTMFAEGVDIGEKKKVKFWDKIKALELLGKHMGLFAERTKYYVNGQEFKAEELVEEKAKDMSKVGPK